MKLAIHNRSGSFSNRWIELCRERGIDHSVVDCRSSNIMDVLRDADGLLWHFHHQDAWSRLAAFPVLYSAEAAGMKVFPNFKTIWHFDDKIAQKYLLEAHNAPLAPTWVFYTKEDALEWISQTSFPKVFKLACGAGSMNVKLVRDAADAHKLIDQAFGEGFVAAPGYLADMRRKFDNIHSTGALLDKIKRAPASLSRARKIRQSLPRQKGYVYFQEFMPGNEHDTRVTVVGDRAFAFMRGVRPGDFRASGSGLVVYDPDKIDKQCIELAFETARKLEAQSVAFDFIYGPDKTPCIVEISYAYVSSFVHDCPGHWDSGLNWHEGQMWPEDAILDDLLG